MRDFLDAEKWRQVTRCLPHVLEFVRQPLDMSSTCVRDENSHENFKRFKILVALSRVLAT